MVIAPAKTGKDINSKIEVNIIDHENKEILFMVIKLDRIVITEVIILIDPKIEDVPAICNEKMVKSIDKDLWNILLDKGGYIVQPVPVPDLIIILNINNISLGGSNQNLILFIRGKDISIEFIIMGINQFPNPPINIGITKKKIIIKACEVTIKL